MAADPPGGPAGARGGPYRDPGGEPTFYGMLRETEQRWLRDRGTNRVYQAGYLMTIEGDPAENVMVLMHGLAAATCVTEAGAEMLLRLYGPGDLVGGEAALDHQIRQEKVQALIRCSALVIPADQFADLHRSAGIARAFGLTMIRRVQDADERARTRLAPPVVQVARALLEVAARVGIPLDGAVTIPVDLSQETLATWITASRATAARVLSELREANIISTGYRKITITDPGRLLSIAASTAAAALAPGSEREITSQDT